MGHRTHIGVPHGAPRCAPQKEDGTHTTSREMTTGTSMRPIPVDGTTTVMTDTSRIPNIHTITGTTTITNTRPSTGEDSTDFTMISYNCKGFKQSVDAISTMVLNCDLVGLSETWLRPGELASIKLGLHETYRRSGVSRSDIHVFAKSAMEESDASYRGRPFGGVAIVCKDKRDLNYTEIPTPSDRIVAIKISDINNTAVHIVINVYMPFYQPGNSIQTDKFVDTIDALQVLVDDYAAIAPIKIIGDLNVKLPSKASLSTGWYRKDGFTPHSLIFYDFMICNDMVAADLISEQTLNYTYFCDANSTRTWIDHCLSTRRDINNVKNCEIISVEGNLSDHLPIRTTLHIPRISPPIINNLANINNSNKQGYTKWDNYARNTNYKDHLSHRLSVLGPFVANPEDIQTSLDFYMDKLCEAIHSAAHTAGCTGKQKYSPKPYWCPRLSQLRDKKRFWWRLWSSNGKPRSGQVYLCYKGVKTLFRKTFRQSITSITDKHYRKLQSLYNKRNMRTFWNEIRNNNRTKVTSTLQPDQLKDFYSSSMQETYDSPIDDNVVETVNQYYDKHCHDHNVQNISPKHIMTLIDNLRHNASSGADGVSADHLKYGQSEYLCQSLSSVYSAILTYCYVPTTFTHGVIIPVLKKSTLNSNVAANYRPITISSTFAKLLELQLIPQSDIAHTQFGFRKKMGTAFGCSLLSDVFSYFKCKDSPLYMCSLDAEKCFDNVCHKSLFYKLCDIIPSHHWVLCYRWYSSLRASVKWQGSYSSVFTVSKGTRQGSILSPYFFNVFINDLLLELQTIDSGVSIGNINLNSFAYADDINLFCSNASGLQMLINKCYEYSMYDCW